jgi:hypothetical protein
MGISFPPNFGLSGISTNDYINDYISITYEDSDLYKYPIYCGETYESKLRLRFMFIDLFDEKNKFHEFYGIYVLDDGLKNYKLIKLTSDEDFNYLSFDSNKWREFSLFEMLNSCSTFVRMMDIGYTWKPCKEFDDLKDKLLEFLDN